MNDNQTGSNAAETVVLTRFRTRLAEPPSQVDAGERQRPRWRLSTFLGALVAIAALVAVALAPVGVDAGQLSPSGRLTLLVFVIAVWAWAFTPIDDTYVALGAGTVLVVSGVVPAETFFNTLGDDVVWLLVAAFVIATAVATSGLAVRAAAWLVTAARTPRALMHIVTTALVCTAFAIPATSGRAALALPVFISLAAALEADRFAGAHRNLVRALAIAFPTVILLSAVGSLIGAGAHLVTAMLVERATGTGFSFATWLLLGLPLAIVSSHLAAELVLRLFTNHTDRSQRLEIDVHEMEAHPGQATGPLSVAEGRAAGLLAVVMVLWCTEALHGLHPAIVALGGALVATSPRVGITSLKKALPKVPWSLLLFMAATLALGDALLTSGAAQWLAQGAFDRVAVTSPTAFVVAVVVVSTLAHLLIQSRSARSAVLIPIVIALAPGAGVSVAAAAFASTAAAGFCHTLPSSAKPVALFADIEGRETYTAADLRRLSLWLGPLSAAVVLAFSFFVWPVIGLPLHP